ncbi:MAG: hypothetical protein J2P25_22855, partial [Nocardiopsaceae bacterium]|nr:hypothetical protein [Nocardiopsaceae bacterium]
MPERVNEAGEFSDKARKAVITEAAAQWEATLRKAELWQAAPGDAAALTSEEAVAFLDAYFRLVATEDLIPAGADRIARTVASHATLGATRPQGRAVVGVREAA